MRVFALSNTIRRTFRLSRVFRACGATNCGHAFKKDSPDLMATIESPLVLLGPVSEIRVID